MRDGQPTPVPGRFTGQRVVISGAGSGVGKAAALRFADEGGAVVVADVDLGRATSVADEITAAGGLAQAALLDQSDENSVADLFRGELVEDGVDVVCINAGIAAPEVVLVDTSADTWFRIHGVNLAGAFLMARAAIPLLTKRGGGSILFTASTSGLRAHPLAAPYAASKAGLLGLSRSLAVEIAELGIRVNCICPGAIRTQMVEDVYGAEAAEMLRLGAAEIPLQRVAEPEDIAAVMAFLASSDARHITASEIVVDGGEAAKFG